MKVCILDDADPSSQQFPYVPEQYLEGHTWEKYLISKTNSVITIKHLASKGFDVMMCPWRRAEIAKQQVEDYKKFKATTNKKISRHYRGFIQTVWTSAENFLGFLNGTKTEPKYSTAECFKTLFDTLVP